MARIYYRLRGAHLIFVSAIRDPHRLCPFLLTIFISGSLFLINMLNEPSLGKQDFKLPVHGTNTYENFAYTAGKELLIKARISPRDAAGERIDSKREEAEGSGEVTARAQGPASRAQNAGAKRVFWTLGPKPWAL